MSTYEKLVELLLEDLPAKSYDLKGKLYKSSSGYVLLKVPNELVLGAFRSLDVPGLQYPTDDGTETNLEAHISVIRSEEYTPEVDKYLDKEFRYTLGELYTVVPDSWKDVKRVWYIKVDSPELQALRTSLYLPPKPNLNRFEFHITVAVERT